MSWALLQLASVTGDTSFENGDGVDRTRTRLFDADRGNWLDLRIPDEAIFQVTWCHGAGHWNGSFALA